MKIFVTVKPGSRTSEVVKESENIYLLRVKSPARDGKANREVVELFSNYFKIPKSGIEIVSGLKSRKKIISIDE